MSDAVSQEGEDILRAHDNAADVAMGMAIGVDGHDAVVGVEGWAWGEAQISAQDPLRAWNLTDSDSCSQSVRHHRDFRPS